MVVTFNILDSVTKTPISGVVRFILYNIVYYIPFQNGFLQLPLTGSYNGLTRRFTVISEGYVNHSDLFIQNDSPTFNIELVRFAGVPAPVAPEVAPEPPSNLAKLATLGIIGAAIIR